MVKKLTLESPSGDPSTRSPKTSDEIAPQLRSTITPRQEAATRIISTVETSRVIAPQQVRTIGNTAFRGSKITVVHEPMVTEGAWTGIVTPPERQLDFRYKNK